MRLTATDDGGAQPFEGERTVTLRALPEGAQVTLATARLEPLDGPGFAQEITFGAPVNGVAAGALGAVAISSGQAVEVHFHARRTLAHLTGTGLDGGRLLVDLGGGMIAVSADGGLGARNDQFPITTDQSTRQAPLPGLTVTGLRIAGTPMGTVSAVGITSPPSDVTLALAGGVPLFVHAGPLAVGVDVPDFAAQLRVFLSTAQLDHGCYVLPFTMRSSSLGRLRLRLDLEFVFRAGGLPEGVDQVALAYGYEGRPTRSNLQLALPAGAQVTTSAGRVRGALQPTAVVAGPITDEAAAAPTPPLQLTPNAPHAQPVTLGTAAQVSAFDLRLSQLAGSADLRLDLFTDAGGRPSRSSLLPAPVPFPLPANHPLTPAWISVPLAEEIRLEKGERYWVTVLPVTGNTGWAVRGLPAQPESGMDLAPGVSVTHDGGLSWRLVDGGLAAQLRVRHNPAEFTVPVTLELGSGPARNQVALDRFAARGGIDIALDFPEVAEKITAVAAAGGACPLGELLVDGAVHEWYRTGHRVTKEADANVAGSTQRLAACPDGQHIARLYHGGDGIRLDLVDPSAPGAQRFSTLVAERGSPVALDVHPGGAFAAVALTAGQLSFIPLVSLSEENRQSPPVLSRAGEAVDLSFSADGRFLYLLEQLPGEKPGRVARIDLDAWCLVTQQQWPPPTGGGVVTADVSGQPVRLAVSATGSVWVLTRDPVLLQRFSADLAELASVPPGSLGAGPYDLTTSFGRAVVPGMSALTVVDENLNQTTVPLTAPPDGGLITGTTAADPLEPRVLLARPDGLVVADLNTATTTRARFSLANPTALALGRPGDQGIAAKEDKLITLRLGALLPLEWTLISGTARPLCPPNQAGTAVGLGAPGTVGESAIAQMVAVTGGCSYRLSAHVMATDQEARIEVGWRDATGAVLRTDTLPITTVTGSLLAPADARQAEIRVLAPTGLVTIASLSFTGVADVLTDPGFAGSADRPAAWRTLGGAVITTSGPDPVVTAAGPGPAAVEQSVPVLAGERYLLRLRSGLATPAMGAHASLSWADSSGRPINAEIDLPVLADGFDLAQAAGVVPDGAVTARVAVVLQPGAVLPVSELAFELTAHRGVEVDLVSEAPGALTVAGLEVTYDMPTLRRPAPPEAGLAAPETTGACSECGSREMVGEGDSMSLPSGRAARPVTCGRCGSVVVRVGGLPTKGRPPVVELARLHWACAPHRPLPDCPDAAIPLAGPAAAVPDPSSIVSAPVTSISGIGSSRARLLREQLQIKTRGQLADATPERLAEVCGVSVETARAWIAEAGNASGV